MKALIAYATKTGASRRCARHLAKLLGADVADLAADKPDLSTYDTVVVGGGIRAGALNKDAKNFITQNTDALAQKKLGFFTCNASGLDDYLNTQNFGPLLDKAVVRASFGGEVDPDNVTGIAKTVLKSLRKIADKNGSIQTAPVDEAAIESFAQALKEA